MVTKMLAPLIAMWERRTMAFEDRAARGSPIIHRAESSRGRPSRRATRQRFTDNDDGQAPSDERGSTSLWKLIKLIC